MTKLLTKIKITLILSLFLMTFCGTISAEFYSFNDFSGGLNNKFTNIAIADNEAADIRNINISSERGAIVKRTGYVVISSNTVAGAYEINGLYDYQQGDSDSYVIACSSNTIKKLNTNGIDWDIICSTSSIISGDYYDFTTFNNTADDTDSLIIVDGTSIPKKYNGGTNTIDIGTGTDPDDRRPNYASLCETYKNRLWFSGKMQEANGGVAGSVVYNRIRYSGDYGAPNVIEGADAWPADWTFTADDEKVTGLKTFNGALVVFGLNSISEIRGEMYASTNGFVIRQVLRGVGCISDRTIAAIDNEIYFLDRSGNIYSYDGSGVTLRSDKIATTIAGLNKSQLTKAAGCYYPKYHQYLLAVANGSSSTNNLLLVYDTLLQAWTVYDGINASSMALVEISNALYLYVGDASGGYIYKLDSGDIDYPLNVATGINAYYTTKYFSLPLTEQEKIFDSVYLTVEQTGNYNLVMTSKMDFEKTQNTQLITLASANPKWDECKWNDSKWGGVKTTMIKKLSISKAANFMSLIFNNSNYGQPFKIYGFGLRVNTNELR